MKDHVKISHLTKFYAFRVNRDQVIDLETWFKIHTNVSNVKRDNCRIPLFSYHLKEAEMKITYICSFLRVSELMKKFKSLQLFRDRLSNKTVRDNAERYFG